VVKSRKGPFLSFRNPVLPWQDSVVLQGAQAPASSLNFDPGFTEVSAFYESIKFHEPQNIEQGISNVEVNTHYSAVQYSIFDILCF
jgi:hypothetical protein